MLQRNGVWHFSAQDAAVDARDHRGAKMALGTREAAGHMQVASFQRAFSSNAVAVLRACCLGVDGDGRRDVSRFCGTDDALVVGHPNQKR